MDWYLAAPFIFDSEDRWLTAHVPNDDGRMSFRAVPAAYRHDRSRAGSSLRDWGDYFRHGAQVWRAARAGRRPSGILTCFPQLPIAVGLRKRAALSRMPLVAWNFNLGQLYTGARRTLARTALAGVDRFVVHSRSEIAGYSEWLDIDPARFEFIPLQRATMPITLQEDHERPFVLSMGSAHRDYRLLFGVLKELGLPAVVVAGPHAFAGL